LKEVFQLVEAFLVDKIFKSTTVDITDISADNSVQDDVSYTLHIAENRRHECPKLLNKILDQEIFALTDAGCELSIITYCRYVHLYNKLRHEGLKCFELPQRCTLNLLRVFKEHQLKITDVARK
jgi:hypothetical protein